jgi:hypothetical protein
MRGQVVCLMKKPADCEKEFIMRFFTVCLLGLFVTLPPLHAENLPDGTVVDSSLIKPRDKESTGFSFLKPVTCRTPFGDLVVNNFNFIAGMFEYYLAETQPVKTAVGTIQARVVMIKPEGGTRYLAGVTVGAPSPIVIPGFKAVLRADKDDDITFKRNGSMASVSIDYKGIRNLELNGSVFRVRGIIDQDSDGEKYRIELAEPGEFDTGVGKLSFIRRVSFYPDGKVDFGSLARPQTIPSAAGELLITDIMFTNDGKIYNCILAKVHELETRWGRLRVTGQIRISDNGRVQEGALDGVQEISFGFGKVKAKGRFDFDPADGVSRFILAEKASVTAPLGPLVISEWFITHENGALSRFVTAKALPLKTPYGEFTAPSASILSLSPDGKIESFTVDKPRIIQTHIGKIKIQEFLSLYSDGRVSGVNVVDPVTVATAAGKCLVKGDLAFFADGAVESCELAKPALLKTQAGTLSIKKRITFREGGVFKSGVLAGTAKIKGVSYGPDYEIELDAAGNVTSPLPGK